MSRAMDRRWALLMLAAETTAVFTMLNLTMVPIIICLIAIGGVAIRFSYPLSTFRLTVLCSVLLVYISFRSSIYPLEINMHAVTLGELGSVIAEYCMIVQLLLLFWRREGGTTIAFSLFGGIVLMCAGDNHARGWDYAIFQSVVIVYMSCLAGLATTYRDRRSVTTVSRGRTIIIAATLLVTAALAASASSGLYRYQHELDAALMSMAYPMDDFGSGVRLSENVQLGSVAKAKVEGKTRIAVRVDSEAAPGYLRANVFDFYESPNWRNSTVMNEVRPVASDTMTGMRRYPIEALSRLRVLDDSLVDQTVWPADGSGADIFTQLDTAFVEMEDATITSDLHGSVHSLDRRAGSRYTLLKDTAMRGADLPDILRERLLEIPDIVTPEMRALAEELFEGLDTPEQKAASVIRYFLANHQYEIGVHIPTGEEPIEYFLREKPPAHCEFFASSAVILLRLGGVPARYVTGFVCNERNSAGDYWLARSKDAHAWVEIWVDGEGWTVVEATPANGVPNEGEVRETSAHVDSLRFKLQQWREAVLSGRLFRRLSSALQQFLTWLGAFLASPVGMGILASSAIAFGYRRWIRKRRVRSSDVLDVDPLRLSLDSMERQLAERGVVRQPAETLGRFALRLETEHEDIDEYWGKAAAWLRDYESVRYNPMQDHDAFETELRDRVETFTRELSSR